MSRTAKLFSLIWILGCVEASVATASDFGSVDQSESYSYTRLKQVGDKTKIKVRQLDPRQFERIRARLTTKVDRIAESYSERSIRFGEQSGSGINAAGDSVSLDQSGTGNQAVATQIGTNDSALIGQSGSENAVFAVQLGDNLNAMADQSGDHNITFIVQRTGRSWRTAPSAFQGFR